MLISTKTTPRGETPGPRHLTTSQREERFAYHRHDYIPALGLGLPFASDRPTDKAFAAALRARVIAPTDARAPKYRMPRGAGGPNLLGVLFGGWLEEKSKFPGAPSPDHGALQALGDEDYPKLVSFMPTIDLPSTGDWWIYAEHLPEVLNFFAHGHIDLRSLRAPTNFPIMDPTIYRRPRAGGDVTTDHVAHFTRHFPAFEPVLHAMLPWSDGPAGRSADARAANAIARRYLGRGIDLRIGRLLPIGLAYDTIVDIEGDVLSKDGSPTIADLMRSELKHGQLRRANPLASRPAWGLENAVWSCDIDSLLSDRRIWQRVK